MLYDAMLRCAVLCSAEQCLALTQLKVNYKSGTKAVDDRTRHTMQHTLVWWWVTIKLWVLVLCETICRDHIPILSNRGILTQVYTFKY